MRSTFIRVFAVILMAAVVASCDSATTPCTGVSCSSGGTGGGPVPSGTDTTGPILFVDNPTPNMAINAGDTIVVSGRAQDLVNLRSVTMSGITVTGDPAIGTATETNRYKPVTLNFSGNGSNSFRQGMVPVTPVDTTTRTMLVRVTATDAAGNSTTLNIPVRMVVGPKVTIIAPAKDSVPKGGPLTVIAAGLQPSGLDSITATVTSGTGFATPLNGTYSIASGGKATDTLTTTFTVPANAPTGGLITVQVTVRDLLGQIGTKSVTVPVCGACGTLAPRVVQNVPPRVEYADGIRVHAKGTALRWVGLIVSDSADNLLRRDSVAAVQPAETEQAVSVFDTTGTLTSLLAQQGRKLRIRSFAVDSAGRTGYSLTSLTSTPVDSLKYARVDTTRVAYGRTYAVNLTRQGTIGDLAVDPVRGNVILSNTSYNLLEVWNDASRSYQNPVPVGSLPWGLFVSTTSADTLLVANSGATTVSRVYLGSGATNTVKEDLARRIRTRNSFVYKVTYSLQNGVVRLIVEGPISYSDRPQYLAQAKSGRLYFSTRPTDFAPEGTLRWLDPSKPTADAHQLHNYVPYLSTADITWVVFNADSVGVVPATYGVASDTLVIWDHNVDTTDPSVAAKSTNPETALQTLQGMINTDVDMVYRLDATKIGLTDTTFASASGDRSWVAFGEGNTTGSSPGRIMMINDPSLLTAPTFSPLVSTADLMENASEKVFGLAIDSIGRQVGAHGFQSYVAAVDDPFQLRLEGVYDSFDDGAGIAFDPHAQGPTTPQRDRLMFVASKSGSIEIVDIAYFNNRGTLPLKSTLYGPLRASLPLTAAEQAAGIVMKLYALTPGGLVVVDLTAADIKDGP